MGGEVATAASWQEKATERIRGVFVDLIPDEDLKKMVTAEFKRFTEDSRGYGGGEQPSELKILIRAELKAKYLARVREELGKLDLDGHWDNGVFHPSEFLKELAKECAPEMIAALFGGLIREATQQTKYALANMARPN